MITETSRVDQISEEPNGILIVRIATTKSIDGVPLPDTYHRMPVVPGQDLTGLDPKVVAYAQLVHTPEVIAAYEAAIQAQMDALLLQPI